MRDDLSTEKSTALDVNMLTKNKLTYLLSITIALSFVAFYTWRSDSPLASIAFFLVSLVCTAVIAIDEVKRMFR